MKYILNKLMLIYPYHAICKKSIIRPRPPFHHWIGLWYSKSRRYSTLDFKKFVNRPLNKIEPTIINILRLGIYQIVFMDKIPESAACNEAVNLAKNILIKVLQNL